MCESKRREAELSRANHRCGIWNSRLVLRPACNYIYVICELRLLLSLLGRRREGRREERRRRAMIDDEKSEHENSTVNNLIHANYTHAAASHTHITINRGIYFALGSWDFRTLRCRLEFAARITREISPSGRKKSSNGNLSALESSGRDTWRISSGIWLFHCTGALRRSQEMRPTTVDYHPQVRLWLANFLATLHWEKNTQSW